MLYCGKCIQNNSVESENNPLKSMISLKGPHTITSLGRRIQTFYIMRNNHNKILAENVLNFHHAKIFLNQRFKGDFHGDFSILEVNYVKN